MKARRPTGKTRLRPLGCLLCSPVTQWINCWAGVKNRTTPAPPEVYFCSLRYAITHDKDGCYDGVCLLTETWLRCVPDMEVKYVFLSFFSVFFSSFFFYETFSHRLPDFDIYHILHIQWHDCPSHLTRNATFFHQSLGSATFAIQRSPF